VCRISALLGSDSHLSPFPLSSRQNESDPTTLRAAMSGKLVRYLVEDGAAVAAGMPYAECEVMKM
jgi:biotin carboxyl carrier protein